MAIYNLDAVNEQLNENSVLDNMLEACDYMMDVLNLDEGAHRKYMEMQAKKQDALEKKSKMYDDLAKNLTGKAAEKSKDNARKYATASSELYHREKGNGYIDDSANTGHIKDELKDADKYGKHDSYYYHQAKEKWMKDHGNKGEDKLANKKPGVYLDAQKKKRAIKETCLHILSIIDDIDN